MMRVESRYCARVYRYALVGDVLCVEMPYYRGGTLTKLLGKLGSTIERNQPSNWSAVHVPVGLSKMPTPPHSTATCRALTPSCIRHKWDQPPHQPAVVASMGFVERDEAVMHAHESPDA